MLNVHLSQILIGQVPPDIQVVIPVLITIISVVIIFFVFIARIVKCGPDEVLIVSGGFGRRTITNISGISVEKSWRFVHAGATFHFPFIQKVDRLSMAIQKYDMQMQNVQSKNEVRFEVDCHAQVKIKSDNVSIFTAAETLLPMSPVEVREIIVRIFEGHTRTIIGSLSAEEIGAQRAEMAPEISEIALEDLSKMGMTIISFTIHNIHRTSKSADVQ